MTGSTSSIVQVLHSDAIERLLPPLAPRLVGGDPCRYCLCVKGNGGCDVQLRRSIEINNGFDCGNGHSIFRDLDGDAGLIPYKKATTNAS